MHRRDGVRFVSEPEELGVGIHPDGSDEAGGEVEDKGPNDGHGEDFAQTIKGPVADWMAVVAEELQHRVVGRVGGGDERKAIARDVELQIEP